MTEIMHYYFKCVDCGKEFKQGEVEYVCPSCAALQKKMEPTRGVLEVLFDYKKFKSPLTPLCKGGTGGILLEHFLPISDLSLLPPLKVGPTPLYKDTRLAEGLGFKNLYIKDDTGLPTGSYKDRASSFVVAKARELKKKVIVCASTGNAATALSGMCASVGMNCVIFVPGDAPPAKLTQIAVYGANLIPIKGTYDDAFELSLEATKKFGWYNRNTAFNPFTIEGKKSAVFEIYEQMGGVAPDKVFIPTGDGVILAGIYKGFKDLKEVGLIDKIPQMVAVQAEGSCVIAKMFSSVILSEAKDPPHETSHTIADSISVSAPRNANWAVKILKETGGFAVTVSDKEIISAIKRLGSLTGIFAEPAAAASAAGFFKCADKLDKKEKIVLMITGSGLKDIPAAQKAITIPKPIKPDISLIKA